MSTELIEIKEETVLQAYTSGDGLGYAVDQVRDHVRSFEHDMSTQTSRAKSKSLAAQVAKVKGKLDGFGKELVAEWKGKAKVVDASRKVMRDTLDDLRDEAKKPVEEWEAEQIKIAADKLAAQKAEEAARKMESDHEFGILMNDKHDLEAQEEARQEEERAQEEAFRQKTEKEEQARADERFRVAQEEARIEREEKIKQEAAQKAEADKELAIKQKQQAEEDFKASEKLRLDQAAQAKIDIAAAAEQARLDQIAAQQAEENRKQAELRKLEANKQHVGKVRKAAKESLISLGLPEALAKTVVLAISKSQIEHVSINYQ